MLHIITEVMTMADKYAATYKFGNTVVHVVAPPPMTEERKKQILADFHHASWAVWNSLSDETKLRLNAEAEKDGQRRII
ncbi:hypothetical protein [Anaeroselena agilis]|uniref:Uncharacterized protein n=1 Tax=Anaeroselena agilis TaxID=3063788 RepID=A0ABU3NZX4_9FIRM|nr:hypothetical protein [Selenomonadales bacterium 4137-cl]